MSENITLKHSAMCQPFKELFIFNGKSHCRKALLVTDQFTLLLAKNI